MKYKPVEFELLKAIKEQNLENIEMLRAILLRAYIDFTKRGFLQKEAVAMLVKSLRYRKNNTEQR